MKRTMVTGLLAAAFVFAVVGPAHSQTDPGAVARALIDAENAHDVNAALALFADDAVVTHATGTLRTRDEIRAWQTELATGNFKATITTPQVTGERATFSGTVELDTLRSLGVSPMESTWDVTVQQGKVKTFTFAFTPAAAARLQNAIAAAQPREPIARTGAFLADWAIGGTLILLAGTLLVVAGRRRPTWR
jgi:hypothetical protein